MFITCAIISYTVMCLCAVFWVIKASIESRGWELMLFVPFFLFMMFITLDSMVKF